MLATESPLSGKMTKPLKESLVSRWKSIRLIPHGGWGNNTPDAAGFTAIQKTDAIGVTRFEPGDMVMAKNEIEND